MLNDWVILLRLLIAAVLSGIVGFERESHGRDAGFRTHILLCIGSTLTMLTSIHIFDVYINKVPCDPARMAAGVVTGIGFLGAGTIMQARGSIRGLTTAASLWVVAGIGLAVGSGLYFGAIVTTAITVVTLMFFSKLEHTMIRKEWHKMLIIDTTDVAGCLASVRSLLDDYGAGITDFDVARSGTDGGMSIKIGVKIKEERHGVQLVQDLSRMEGIKSVRWAHD